MSPIGKQKLKEGQKSSNGGVLHHAFRSPLLRETTMKMEAKAKLDNPNKQEAQTDALPRGHRERSSSSSPTVGADDKHKQQYSAMVQDFLDKFTSTNPENQNEEDSDFSVIYLIFGRRDEVKSELEDNLGYNIALRGCTSAGNVLKNDDELFHVVIESDDQRSVNAAKDTIPHMLVVVDDDDDERNVHEEGGQAMVNANAKEMDFKDTPSSLALVITTLKKVAATENQTLDLQSEASPKLTPQMIVSREMLKTTALATFDHGGNTTKPTENKAKIVPASHLKAKESSDEWIVLDTEKNSDDLDDFDRIYSDDSIRSCPESSKQSEFSQTEKVSPWVPHKREYEIRKLVIELAASKAKIRILQQENNFFRLENNHLGGRKSFTGQEQDEGPQMPGSKKRKHYRSAFRFMRNSNHLPWWDSVYREQEASLPCSGSPDGAHPREANSCCFGEADPRNQKSDRSHNRAASNAFLSNVSKWNKDNNDSGGYDEVQAVNSILDAMEERHDKIGSLQQQQQQHCKAMDERFSPSLMKTELVEQYNTATIQRSSKSFMNSYLLERERDFVMQEQHTNAAIGRSSELLYSTPKSTHRCEDNFYTRGTWTASHLGHFGYYTGYLRYDGVLNGDGRLDYERHNSKVYDPMTGPKTWYEKGSGYSGHWENGVPHGQGIAFSSDGSIGYDGEWYQGRPVGWSSQKSSSANSLPMDQMESLSLD